MAYSRNIRLYLGRAQSNSHSAALAFSSGVLALTSDTTALGLALVTLWLALWLEMARYRAESPSSPGRAPSPLDVAARHLGTFSSGYGIRWSIRSRGGLFSLCEELSPDCGHSSIPSYLSPV